MARTKSKHNGGGNHGGNGLRRKSSVRVKLHRAAPVPADIGTKQVKHLLRAPGGYPDIARQFAHGLEQTNFRGAISAAKIRALLARGERLSEQASVARVRAAAADRQRMVHDSQLWKSILSTWRMIVAAMPDHAELEKPFAFMQAYMSVSRSTTPVETPLPPASPLPPPVQTPPVQ